MESLHSILRDTINGELYQVIVSNPVNKEQPAKKKIRPLTLRGEMVYQESTFDKDKVYHKNLSIDEATELILQYSLGVYKQIEIETKKYKITCLVSKKGRLTIKKTKRENEAAIQNMEHNRIKKYILKEGIPVPFLIDLGVQTEEGKIIKQKYDKFRQINRYLEFVQDILSILPNDRAIRIIDFGCGKSYLTFALYYYLYELLGRDVLITGLDLKQDVIQKCNGLAKKYQYEGLTFQRGDIALYEEEEEIDMVVTLHACDTATDYALEKAIRWNAKVIFSVPCCQHELNKQIQSEILNPVLKYGLIKERISSLLTDGIRAQLLNQMGYETQILEFIDLEHTPKNILLRAVKKFERKSSDKGLTELLDAFHLKPTLKELLDHLQEEESV